MNKDTAAFEERLRGRFAEVSVPESLAPENIGALLQKEKRNPSVYIVRRVSVMAAACLVCALGALTLMLHADGVGMDNAAAETAYAADAAVNGAMFDAYDSDTAPAASQAASDGAGGTADARTKEETDGEFEALVEAENARLEAARAKGDKR